MGEGEWDRERERETAREGGEERRGNKRSLQLTVHRGVWWLQLLRPR